MDIMTILSSIWSFLNQWIGYAVAIFALILIGGWIERKINRIELLLMEIRDSLTADDRHNWPD